MFRNRENIAIWTREAEINIPDCTENQWGYVKHKIGEFSRSFGAKLKKGRRILKSNIEKELAEISINITDYNKARYSFLQNQLNEIIDNEIKGSILRSLCQEYEEGEKCTKYFFSLEKFRAKQKTITRLQKEDNTFISDTEDILKECRQFYQKLYSKNFKVDPSLNECFF